MFIVLAVIIIALGGGSLALILENSRLRQRLNALPNPQDEDDVLAFLEAAATVSPMAQRLLDQAKDVKHLPAPPKVEKPPGWLHDPDARVPAETQWMFFWSEFTRVEHDTEALDVLKSWVENGSRFTMHERTLILDQFNTSTARNKARGILSTKKKEKVPAPKKKKAGTESRGPG